ncbi:hypothetical protein DU504_00590 [Haloplanus salinus]|uniref:Uncharacterized protein n=1 Tax=Haloplanus salinus TaxID=1126245 RepID=A0A368N5V8_9EURY|nr:hypothetical protein [Haloplanus salinus]RCU45928.1 hypothetical protein DU504_00590 [Haloplanus salinus]
MADKKFTLLELHLDEGSIQVGPAALGAGGDGITEPESKDSGEGEGEGESEGDASCPGRKLGKLLVALLVIAVLVLGLKKVLGGGSEDLDELEELSELDEE